MTKDPLILLLLLLLPGHARAQGAAARPGTDSVRVYFRQGDARLDPYFRENGARLRAFTDRFRTLLLDPSLRIRGLRVTAGASPEGTPGLNRRLSERRAEAIRSLVYRDFPREVGWLSTVPKGADWDGLERLVAADGFMPYRWEVLDVLRYAPGELSDGRKRRLETMRGGSVWRYMDERFFPELRASVLHVWYESDDRPQPARDTVVVVQRQEEAPEPVREPAPLYLGLKTNLLYDALVVPNVGAEIYLGRGWSLAAGWMYTWLRSDRRHRYHRIYGGDLEARRWLSYGRKPLTGHHVGLYAQMLTYDLEWGGRGYLGDRWSYGGGVAYGYSAPIGRRLNIDLTLGIGYLGGKYYEYVPKGWCEEHHRECYLWQATKQRHWFGPTRAEVSLVWLIGHDNHNRKKKGGNR